ncbi:MAG: carph-isopro domain-containing protein [Geminicoccaceae bacterium]
MTSPDDIVERLGGRGAVAAAFPDELTPKAVFMWTKRGHIPGRWHLRLMDLAERTGVSLSANELLSMTRRGDSASDTEISPKSCVAV